MPALENQIAAADVVTALDVEFIENFTHDVNQLMEVLGIFGVETMNAGTALYQYKVTGSLNTSEVAEGDEVPLSKYTVAKTPIGELETKPYRKLTTRQAILKAGFENAVLKTDDKMGKDMRADIVKAFFTFLGKGTGTAKGVGLQAALAQVDAALENALEDNNDSTARIVHFVNRNDIADYLATAPITTQTVFGMTYIKDFLGVTDIFVTNKVPKGTIYATPVENIHIYGADFGALAQAGLSYTVQDGGLIGVHHVANYARTSAETHALSGVSMLPEVTNYIVKGTIEAAAAAASARAKASN